MANDIGSFLKKDTKVTKQL